MTFATPNLDIDSGINGDVTTTITMRGLDNTNANVWTQTATVPVGKILSKDLTATAATAKKISGDGFAVKVADLYVTENQPAVLAAADTVTLTIQTSGVKFKTGAAIAPTGTAGLASGTCVFNAARTTATTTIATGSAAIGGQLTFDLSSVGQLDVAPGTTGDIVINVSSSNTKLDSTDLTVATTTDAAFTVTPKSISDKDGLAGEKNVNIGDLEIKANMAAAWTTNSTVVFTLKNAKFPAASVFPAVAGFTAGTQYNDNKSVWYGVVGAPATTVIFALPNIDINADASGELLVEISGTAGVTGEYSVGTAKAAATYEAVKKNVLVNRLDQAAGDIKITELAKDNFWDNPASTLVLVATNGITWSKNPKVYVNGEQKDPAAFAIAAETLTITGIPINSTKIDTIEIKEVFYDVDSRYVSKDISLEVKGTLLTKNGSTSTIVTLVNAAGIFSSRMDSFFTIGSIYYTVNGTEFIMDVLHIPRTDVPTCRSATWPLPWESRRPTPDGIRLPRK